MEKKSTFFGKLVKATAIIAGAAIITACGNSSNDGGNVQEEYCDVYPEDIDCGGNGFEYVDDPSSSSFEIDDELSSSSSYDEDEDDDSSDDGNGGGNPSEAWIIDKHTFYSVSDGVASVFYEANYNYSYYTDNMNHSYQYNYTRPIDETATYSTYTGYRTGSYKYTYLDTRSDNTGINTQYQLQSTSTTLVYDNGDPDQVTDSHYESSFTYNYELDSETGLALQFTANSTVIINYGEPTYSNSTINHTHNKLSEDDGIITVNYVLGTTSSGYSIYKVKDKVILEIKSYSSDNVLISTQSYSFPDDAVIRERLPTFTLVTLGSAVNETTSQTTAYQTVEVLSNTATELTLRVKTYNADTGALSGQTDTRYIKW